MRYFSSCDQWKLWPLLAAAIACLASTGASASVAVTYYIVVQPIDVCFTVNRTTTCPQVNNLQPPAGFTYQSALSNPSTTSIGFFDATTGKDLTRVMLNQIGVEITCQPLARSNSGTDNTVWFRSSPSCASSDWSHREVLSISKKP